MIILAIQDETTMPQAESDSINQRLVRITSYTENVMLRTERAEEKYLDDWLERLNNQNTQPTTTEQMDMETYKQKVKECLLRNGNAAYVEKRMALYEEDFPEFLRDEWSPAAAAAAIIMGY